MKNTNILVIYNFNKKYFCIFLFISFINNYNAISQSNPNDIQINKRLQAEVLYSYGGSEILNNPLLYGNYSVNKINVDFTTNSTLILNYYNAEFTYDNNCKLIFANRTSVDPNLNSTTAILWPTNQFLYKLDHNLIGEDSNRFVIKYNSVGNITETIRQYYNSQGIWEDDLDYGYKYSNFDNCGNYLEADPNWYAINTYNFDINYLNGTCLPEQRKYTYQLNGDNKNYLETWLYDPFFNKLSYKIESSFSGGSSCDIQEYTYNNNKIETLTIRKCSDKVTHPTYRYYWNPNGTIEKIKYYLNENTIDTFLLYSFSYNSCITSGINEIQQVNIKLSPNPVYNQLNISINDLLKFENSKINIINIMGQIKYSDYLNNSNKSINVSNLPPGLYFLSIETIKGPISKSFIKI